MILALLTASAYAPLSTCGGTPTHWAGPSTWHLTSTGSMYSGLSNAEVTQAFVDGFDVWRDTTSCCSGFQHQYGGEVGQSYSLNDDTNVISFEEQGWDWSLGSVNGVIAVTFSQWAWGCELTDGDQVYNGVGFSFTTTDNPGWGDTDLQSIAAHENGHWVGLDHSNVGAATMYYAYPGGISPRTLHDDDEAGVCNAHPGICGPSEDDCADGWDDDEDGLTDCDDPDCAAYAACQCEPAAALACNVPMTGSNAGRPNHVEQYACMDWMSNGPEAVYTITPGVTGPVTVDLTGLSADLDLFVTTDGFGCNPNGCVGSSGSPNAEPESVTFTGTAGTTYLVIADGWEGATSGFTLTASCQQSAPPPAEGDADTDADADSDADADVDTDGLGGGDTGLDGSGTGEAEYMRLGQGCGCVSEGAPSGSAAALGRLLGRR